MALPEKLTCPQDIEEVFNHFEQQANQYVMRRLPLGTEEPRSYSRMFISPYDTRWVSDYQLEQMRRLDPEFSQIRHIPMQSALNRLKQVQGLLDGECLTSDLLLHLSFDEDVVAAVKKFVDRVRTKRKEREDVERSQETP